MTTGKGSYIWHLNQAARFDLIAHRSHRPGMWREAEEAALKAKQHRDQAAIADREERVA